MNRFRILWCVCAILCGLLNVSHLSAKGVATLNEKIKDYEYVGHFSEGLAVVKKEGKIGFVDKSGEVVIPLKWDNTDREYSLSAIKFSNGRCVIPGTSHSNECLIDKEGNEIYSGKYIRIEKMDGWDIMYVYREEGGHSVYFMDNESIQKMDQYENDYVIVGDSWDYNYPEGSKMCYFSFENLCDGNIVGREKLKNQYGYECYVSSNSSWKGVGLATLLDTKTNKYGIVDEKGNIVVPFQYDNAVFMCYGLLVEVFCLTHDSEVGLLKYPIYCNIYKDGRLLQEKLPYYNESGRIMGMFLFWGTPISEYRERFDFLEDGYQFPASLEKSVFVDVDGKEVSRFSFGKNYLRPVGEWCWQLEDQEGNLVYPKKFIVKSRYKNNVQVELYDEYKFMCITDAGDTIDASFNGYVNAGIISMSEKFPAEFYALCEYDKTLSDRDNYLNCHFSPSTVRESFRDENDKMRTIERNFIVSPNGKKLLSSAVDEVSHFSEGLLRLKKDGRYFFVDKKGKGMIEK